MSSSRWGPKRSSSQSPVPLSTPASQCSVCPTTGLTDDEPDFELTDTTEWGSDDASPFDELAAKPKPDKADDPCGCLRTADGTSTCNDLSCINFACQVECRSNCWAGDLCGNKRIQKRKWKLLEIFNAEKKGKGLRVMEDCQKGDLVAEYVGRAINKNFLPQLFQRYANERKLYIMALDKDIYLDARKKGGVSRYINHSCEPNCVVERWKVRGIMRAAIIAYKDIPAGTELCFDYQWERKRGRAPTKCYCGTPTCRGTLEVPRSMEEEALERQLSNHWKKPLISRAGKEIINRCVKVLSRESQEYDSGDVVHYDEKTGKHLIMYRRDLEEVWEDLKREDWMILDEEAEQFVIRKKYLGATRQAAMREHLLEGMENSQPMSMPGGLQLQGQQQMLGKNYIYVQTPIKEAMYSKHLIERCQRSCRVTITSQQFAKPPLPPDQNDREEVEKYRALDLSMDGTVWKLTIVGLDIAKANSILEKNITFLERKLIHLGGGDPSTTVGSAGMQNHGGTNGGANTSVDAFSTELVLPRSIMDSVKRRLLPLLRDKYKSVDITFAPSESKSKQFAKLIVEGTLQSDVDSAKEHLWSQLNAACEEVKAPKSPSGVYLDLGILGGALSSSDFHRLLEYDKTNGVSNHSNGGSVLSNGNRKNHDAKEDLARWSPFFASFEVTQRCTIWVQADADKGRINTFNQIVSEATPTSPRKVYFGCDPKVVPRLWKLIKDRASDVARGVKYLYLGPDRLYQPTMMRKGGQFFEFVKTVTGASVTVDSMTGDHLRIDGRGGSSSTPIRVENTSNNATEELPSNVSEGERAAMAEELVRLQIELYRDHSIREQNWIFGRDWSLARRSCSNQSSTKTASHSSNTGGGSISPVPNRGSSASLSTRTLSFDSRTLTNACMDIAEIISTLGLEGGVAAHATVILYRVETIIMSQPNAAETLLKLREVAVACIFIANKSQKRTKWKKLEAVLEAAYNSFYPGVSFDSSKEEVLVWEEKVIIAEREILQLLEYDVFWRGFDWITSAATEAGRMNKNMAKDALSFSVSGPVLAAGPDLWLTYGPEYVFAVAAGFLHANLDDLFPALSLIPFKVQQAAEIITSSVNNTGLGRKQSSHPLFKQGRKGLLKHLPRIKETCARLMAQAFGSGLKVTQLAERLQRYRIIGENNRKHRVFCGVKGSIIKEVMLPSLDGLCAESECSIFLEQNSKGGLYDIVLEGSWRAVSIASYLLEQLLKGKHKFGTPQEGKASMDSKSNIQAKGRPGLLQMNKIETVDGWSGTIQSTVSNQSFWGRKTGGKCCVPGKIKESDLRHGGFRWWIPPRYGPSPTGSICDMFLVNNNESGPLQALADLTHAFQGESNAFSMLTSSLAGKRPPADGAIDRFVAVSLQRWPSEKVANREQGKGKKGEKEKTKKSRSHIMQTGFSAAALQEMQLLNNLHGHITSPHGHPNFILPIGVGLPSKIDNGDINLPSVGSKAVDMKSIDEDIFSLTRSSLENEVAAKEERKRKDMVTGPHLIFQPTPFVLHRFLSRKKKRDNDSDDFPISPVIFASWFHDLLSALLHCHANDIILRTFQADQIVIDHSGVAKIGGLYRATVLSREDLNADIVKLARERKKSKKSNSDDVDVMSNPYVAPEMLLGSVKFTKETDIWTMGCLFAHLLLKKPICTAKDRQSLLTAMYKFLGVPTKENFPLGMKLPYFKKYEKKYKPGVDKALQHMVSSEEKEKHAGAIDLISKMLHLDPAKRITAVGALQHEYIQNHVERCNSASVRQQFVQDWMNLKKRLMHSNKSEEDEIKERERGIKRKAMLMAASTNTVDAEEDDLYDMDDIFTGGSPKQPKL